MGFACGAYGCGEGVYRVWVGKREGKRLLGKPRRRWVDNSKMDLQEVCCGYGLDWAGSGWERVAEACMCGNEPSDSVKCLEFLA